MDIKALLGEILVFCVTHTMSHVCVSQAPFVHVATAEAVYPAAQAKAHVARLLVFSHADELPMLAMAGLFVQSSHSVVREPWVAIGCSQ